MTKTYGNLVLMTTICAFVLLASMPAYARPQVVVGKPRIVTVTIRGSMLPPPKYNKPYEGELEIVFFSNSEDIKKVCPDLHTETACSWHSDDLKKCRIHIGTEDMIKHVGGAYAFTLRHELAHCNGWKHPNTTDGRRFKVGETWDAAEGAKWVAANTKVPMPKLPASTRILPASPPVVCVTPEWKTEPCEARKPAVAENLDPWQTGSYEDKWRWCREHHYTPPKCKEL